MLPRAEDIYSCKEDGRPILHDTLVKITLERDLCNRCQSPELSSDVEFSPPRDGTVDIRAVVVTPLKVSLARGQYEQLLDTVHRLVSAPTTVNKPIVSKQQQLPVTTIDSDKIPR